MRPLPKKGYERSEVERLRVEVGKLKGKLATAEENAEMYKKDANLLRKVVHEKQTDSRRYSVLRNKEIVIMEPGGGAKYLTGKDLDEYLEPRKITQEYLEKLLLEMSKNFKSFAQPTTVYVPKEMQEDAENLILKMTNRYSNGTNS